MENSSTFIKNIFLSKEDFDKAKQEYKITESGFLTFHDYDEIELPEFLTPIENIAINLSNLIKESKIQSSINNLEKIKEKDILKISSEKVFQKIFSLASFLTNAYFFSREYKDDEKPIMPENLWLLFKHSSKYLELNPVFVLWSAIHVVRKKEKNCDPIFENIEMKFSFTRSITEKYFLECNYLFEFYLKEFIDKTFEINNICWRHVKYNNNHEENKFEDQRNLNIQLELKSDINNEIEKNKENMFNLNILNIKEDLADFNFNHDELTEAEITQINSCLISLQFSQRKVIELCKLLLTNMDASVFFNELRQFLRGYAYFKNGVGIENSNETLYLSGSSAGQDPMINLLKIFFGFCFSEKMKNYEKGLLDQIRKPHYCFLKILEKFSLIHKLQHHKEIKENFNIGRNLLLEFYKIHKGYILKFISGPAKLMNLNPDELYGVGGTPINVIKDIHNYFEQKN